MYKFQRESSIKIFDKEENILQRKSAIKLFDKKEDIAQRENIS